MTDVESKQGKQGERAKRRKRPVADIAVGHALSGMRTQPAPAEEAEVAEAGAILAADFAYLEVRSAPLTTTHAKGPSHLSDAASPAAGGGDVGHT